MRQLQFFTLLTFFAFPSYLKATFSDFFEKFDIRFYEPVAVTFLINASQTDFSEMSQFPYTMSITTNLISSLCDRGSRNYSGILLQKHNSMSDLRSSLIQISKTEPNCNFPGFYSKIITILDSPPPTNVFEAELSKIADLSNFSLDSDVYIVIPGDVLLEVYELYRINKRSVFQRVEIPINTGFSIDVLTSKLRRHNFRQELLRPIMYYITSKLYYNATIGLVEQLLDDMAWLLNFSYVIVNASAWMSFDQNGNSQGMAKQLENFEGDFLLQASELSLERQAKFDFLFSTFNLRIVALFRQPPTVYPNLIFQPYSLSSWIAFAVSFFSLAICIRTILKLSGHNSGIHEFCGLIFRILGLFTQQGWLAGNFSYTVSLQMTVASGLVLSSFFYNLYSASIISIISAREPPIKSLDQIFQSGMQVYADSNTKNSHRLVERTVDHGQIAERIVTTDEGIRQILNSQSAFLSFRHYITGSPDVVRMSSRIFCDTVSEIYIDTKGLPVHSGMYVRKHASFRKIFMHTQIKRAETGAIKRQEARLSRWNPSCLKMNDRIESLNFGVVSPAFLLAFSVMLLSFIIFLQEIRPCYRS